MAAPSKAQAFTFEVPPDTSVDAIINGIHDIVGVEGLQYLRHQGGPRFLAVVSSMANAGKMVVQGSLRLGNAEVPLVPVGPHVLNVLIFRLPPYVPDEALLSVLNQYGKILQVTHTAYKDHPDIKTGTRIVRMEMAKPVPNFVNIRGHRVMVDYKGLRKVCFRCGHEGHVGSNCTTPRCARCNKFGHKTEGCQTPRQRGHHHATVDCTEMLSYSAVTQEAANASLPQLAPASVPPNHTMPAPPTNTAAPSDTTSSADADELRLIIDEGDHGHRGDSPTLSDDTPSTPESQTKPDKPTSAPCSTSATTTTDSECDIMDYRLGTKLGRPQTSEGSSEGQPPPKSRSRLLKKAASMVEIAPIAKAAAVATVAVVASPYILGAVGFGTAGVAAGSTAAWAQSTFLGGVIVKGSAFATLQSWGAAGIPVAAKAATAAVSAAATLLKKRRKRL